MCVGIGGAVNQVLACVPQGQCLADWIRGNGGYVHHALALSEQTQCGSRCCNVTATSAAALADVFLQLAWLVTQLESAGSPWCSTP